MSKKYLSDYLTDYLTRYLPLQIGASPNTIKSYRDAFTWYDDNQCTGLFRFCVDTCASRISAGERTSAADQDHSYSKEKAEPETGD